MRIQTCRFLYLALIAVGAGSLCLLLTTSFTARHNDRRDKYDGVKPDKPSTPTLTAAVKRPKDGVDITMTCKTTTGGVTAYEFRRNATWLSTSPSSTYTVHSPAFGKDEGSYTCTVYIDTVASDASSPYFVSLTPQTPKISLSHPGPVVTVGTNVTLTCHTQTVATVSFTFIKNGKPLADSSAQNTFVLATPAVGRPGYYQCLVSIGQVKSAASGGENVIVVDDITANARFRNNNRLILLHKFPLWYCLNKYFYWEGL